MRVFRFWLVALVIGLTGCASWHARVRPGFDWSTVSTVALQGPAEAYSELVATAREELEGMGYRVLPAESPEAQVEVQLSVVEALDIDESGKTFMRPKSLHTRFYKSVDQALVAESSYYLGPSESPRQGVKALLAGVRKKQAQAAAVPAQVVTAAPVATPPASKPAVVGPVPVQVAPAPPAAAETVTAHPSQRTAPVAAPSVTAGSTPAPETVAAPQGSDLRQPQAAPIAPAAPPAPVARTEVATEATADDDWDKPRDEIPSPGEPSPWVPRFQSWGFSDWGKSRELE
jgi:hypothetical protein